MSVFNVIFEHVSIRRGERLGIRAGKQPAIYFHYAKFVRGWRERSGANRNMLNPFRTLENVVGTGTAKATASTSHALVSNPGTSAMHTKLSEFFIGGLSSHIRLPPMLRVYITPPVLSSTILGRQVYKSLYLWGTAVPLLPQNIKKNFRGNGVMLTKEFLAASIAERRLLRNEFNRKYPSDKRKAAALAATIPPELANCVVDYAERLLEQRAVTHV